MVRHGMVQHAMATAPRARGKSNRRGERSLAGSRAFQLAEARFQCADTGGERRSRRRLIACNQGFQSAHTPAQSHAQDGADDTGNRDEQERRNHEDPEQIFQGRDPRAAAFGETSFESNRLSSARVLEKTPPAHRPGALRLMQFRLRNDFPPPALGGTPRRFRPELPTTGI